MASLPTNNEVLSLFHDAHSPLELVSWLLSCSRGFIKYHPPLMFTPPIAFGHVTIIVSWIWLQHIITRSQPDALTCRWLGTRLQGQAMPGWAVNSRQYSSICMSSVHTTYESTNTPHPTLLHWNKPESLKRMEQTNFRKGDKSFCRTQPSLRLAETTTATGYSSKHSLCLR